MSRDISRSYHPSHGNPTMESRVSLMTLTGSRNEEWKQTVVAGWAQLLSINTSAFRLSILAALPDLPVCKSKHNRRCMGIQCHSRISVDVSCIYDTPRSNTHTVYRVLWPVRRGRKRNKETKNKQCDHLPPIVSTAYLLTITIFSCTNDKASIVLCYDRSNFGK